MESGKVRLLATNQPNQPSPWINRQIGGTGGASQSGDQNQYLVWRARANWPIIVQQLSLHKAKIICLSVTKVSESEPQRRETSRREG